ncbi:ras association domain-containing protein 4-like [Anneissia japonica]|uniref:ras association domain-containing protein 4-like n=1 Tax=Anneissia japonica TaxID=1529436 RepID=UPI0014255A0A|nr:ras association domain-containing protein 4-like [Anneissia japonica]XP_033103114.1 ras association domain-containing protein 4-like [Anneissia japonica]
MKHSGDFIMEQKYKDLVSSSIFSSQLKLYQQYQSNLLTCTPLTVTEDSNGVMMLHGVLRLYWGVQKLIHLKQEEDQSWKRMSLRTGIDNVGDHKKTNGVDSNRNARMYNSLIIDKNDRDVFDEEHEEEHIGKEEEMNGHHNEDKESARQQVVQRRRHMRRSGRTSSFSGHMYKRKTSIFRPKYGTQSSVTVSSLMKTTDVLDLLLRKFCIVDPTSDFHLYVLRQSGEATELKPTDYPLIQRVKLGPDENVAKIFILSSSDEVTPEVGQYVNLPETVLKGILNKYKEEEENEIKKIKYRYDQYRENVRKKITKAQDQSKMSPISKFGKFFKRK